MFTSYFANIKNVVTPLSISEYTPDWYEGPQNKVLAPPWSLIKAYKSGRVDEAQYTDIYKRDVLGKLDVFLVYNGLVRSYGADVTLLCFERVGEFCHRRIVAAWFEEHCGVQVPELKSPSTPCQKSTLPKRTLFSRN